MILFGMITFRKNIYQKLQILTLIRIFACNSKSILQQRASFSYAGTRILLSSSKPLNIMDITAFTQTVMRIDTVAISEPSITLSSVESSNLRHQYDCYSCSIIIGLTMH